MTRIVAGSAGGRTLQVPRSGTRPTSERVREALFSRLEHLGVVDGARVLDLYAGSGALGLEAASRGATRVTLVEAAKPAAAACRRNAAQLGLAVEVVAAKVETYLAAGSDGEPADLVLLDPPYDVPGPQLARVLTLLAGAPQAPGPAGASDVCRPGSAAPQAPGVDAASDVRRPGSAARAPGDAAGVDPTADRRPWLRPTALVVVERSRRSPEPPWPPGLRRVDQRSYGDTQVWFAEPAG